MAPALTAAGLAVRGFDRGRGEDLRDATALRAAASGCDAVVHAAALAGDAAGDAAEIEAVNVAGTANVLAAAEAAGAGRVVAFSSAQVFGIAEGEGLPVCFPIDDDHPRRAARPYGSSKRVLEDLCAALTDRAGTATVCLRPWAVWSPATYGAVRDRRARCPEAEWSPYWEYGAFVDVRDVCAAVVGALTGSATRHIRATLCAPDISASAPALEMVARLAPSVPWAPGPGDRYEAEPWRALVDCAVARDELGWHPRHTWAGWLATRPH